MREDGGRRAHLRVIQVNKYHYVKGGAERYYLDLSAALRGRGFIVNHLSTHHPRGLPAESGDRLLPASDYHAGGGVRERLGKAAAAIFNLRAHAVAYAMSRTGPRAVVHLHNFYHQLSPSILWGFARSGSPMVMTVHDYKMICPGYTLRTRSGPCERCRGGRYHHAVLHKCLLGSTSASYIGALEATVHRFVHSYDKISIFLCPSRFMRDKLSAFGVRETKLVHLPYFLPLERYVASPPPLDNVCAYVGRLSEEKGLATLIRAVAMLPPGRLRLEIVGEGPAEVALRQLAAELCPNRVRFLGYKSGPALGDAIRAARFTVQPSEFYENLPYGVLEPMAMGRAVLGARIGGIPELVEDDVTGRCFSPGSADSLADGLLWMTSPRADPTRMGLRARARMEAQHAVEPHLERLLGLYDRVLRSE